MVGWRREPYAIPRAFGRLIGQLSGARRVVPQQRGRNPGAVVDCAVYSGGGRRPGAVHYADAVRGVRRQRNSFVWLGLHEPDELTMTSIAAAFGLHELTASQASSGGHRPAVEIIGDVTRLVLRTAEYVEHEQLTATSEVVDTGDVTVLVGATFVITIRHGAAGALRTVRKNLEGRPALLAEGPWAVAFAVCDRMVELYLDVAGRVERDLEAVEASDAPDIAQIYQLKRELVEFKRAVLPLRDPVQRLVEGDLLPSSLVPYLVDVRSRLTRAVERVAGYDDLINSILQARLAQVSVDQNNDMRKIASWAAIAAVQTAIAGVYGMNFANLPGLNWKYGYPAALLAMAVAAVALHRRLKKAGWL
ncbi:magnesium and cobalt transport protein CorA [Actinoplanes sp. TFC3]|uniref:magnesium and cobalt transport protein CorA n=1 Tax=Actinoplanes sp. TFC3 TaxID=1710355 RepID=UPI0008314373|nr:magnesium and cobalt transport protein CorA [Actinoplanes sp. TFC3]